MTVPLFSIDIRGLLDAQQQLQLLGLPAAKRRRLLNHASKRLRTRNTRRIGAQRNLDGSAFEPRKATGKRKMLRRLSTRLQVTRLSTDAATLGWRQPRNARIASEHQTGHSTVMTPALMRRQKKTTRDYDAPLSRKQARALEKAGYQVRDGDRWVPATREWMVQHLKSGQAGLLLARLEGVARRHSWKIDLPARDALGADPSDILDVVGTVLRQTLQSPK